MTTTDRPARTVVEPAQPASGPERIFDRAHAAVTVGAVSLVTLMAYQSLAVTTAMPAVAEAIGGLNLYGLAFGAPLATSLIGMAFSGGWTDARGPARPLLAGSALFAAGIVIAGLAPSMAMVAVGRGIQGLGSGQMLVALYVLVARVYPEHLRPRIFAAFAAAWVLPALIGPTISGLIVEHIGWRWVFLSVAGLVPLATMSLRPGLRQLDGGGSGSLRSALLTGRLAWATVAGLSACTLHMAGQSSIVVAALLLGIGGIGVAMSVARLLPSGTFRAAHGLPALVMLRGLAAAAFLGAEVFIPLLLVREHGLSPALAGLVLTISAVTWSFASWLQGRGFLPDRRQRLRIGMTLLTVGIFGTGLLVVAAVPIPLGIALWAFGGLGMGLVYPTLSVLVLSLSTPEEQGRNSSSMQIADALFTTLALALSGTVFAALLTYSNTWPYLAGFALSSSLAAAGIVVAGRIVPRLSR
ncbi:MFS transporter [Phytoactinopolyspora mesophila]|uniref:MFS transporter n=1 Tax=Phytoactinopolyspora mesophila TaxID=2650750 RepID=A0A7K3MAH3_9ACTN|nr:MFS transporter [Phytoactinopolyspora mesophila]NDL60266.1 MFS transporter [Phytoactinopolyspora mesophila]